MRMWKAKLLRLLAGSASWSGRADPARAPCMCSDARLTARSRGRAQQQRGARPPERRGAARQDHPGAAGAAARAKPANHARQEGGAGAAAAVLPAPQRSARLTAQVPPASEHILDRVVADAPSSAAALHLQNSRGRWMSSCSGCCAAFPPRAHPGVQCMPGSLRAHQSCFRSRSKSSTCSRGTRWR